MGAQELNQARHAGAAATLFELVLGGRPIEMLRDVPVSQAVQMMFATQGRQEQGLVLGAQRLKRPAAPFAEGLWPARAVQERARRARRSEERRVGQECG